MAEDDAQDETAESELLAMLLPGETVEAVVFGSYGWGSAPEPGAEWEGGYGEPEPWPLSPEFRGKVLSWQDAAPLMRNWRFGGTFGAPKTYNTYVWTDSRVIFVHEYDGATGLHAVPRNPSPSYPEHH